MVFFPNCKINIGLNIIGRRNDGYHDLETVFYPVQLKDAIEIIEANETRLSISGVPVDADVENNLCVRAYRLLKKDFPQLPSIQMHLHKSIPAGAGLGGGSADGAFTLRLLNKKFDLLLSEKELIEYALQLGSDCPYFIINKPCFGRGRGDLLQQLHLDLSPYKILIVYPGIYISTAWAFSQLAERSQRPDNYKSSKEIIQQPISTWKKELINDFEEPVFAQYPEIKNIKDELYNAGAVYSSMSGSGAAVYGIFKKEDRIVVDFPKKISTHEVHT